MRKYYFISILFTLTVITWPFWSYQELWGGATIHHILGILSPGLASRSGMLTSHGIVTNVSPPNRSRALSLDRMHRCIISCY